MQNTFTREDYQPGLGGQCERHRFVFPKAFSGGAHSLEHQKHPRSPMKYQIREATGNKGSLKSMEYHAGLTVVWNFKLSGKSPGETYPHSCVAKSLLTSDMASSKTSPPQYTANIVGDLKRYHDVMRR